MLNKINNTHEYCKCDSDCGLRKLSDFYLAEEWSILILLGLGGSVGFPPFPFDEVSSELESSWFPVWLRLTVKEIYK